LVEVTLRIDTTAPQELADLTLLVRDVLAGPEAIWNPGGQCHSAAWILGVLLCRRGHHAMVHMGRYAPIAGPFVDYEGGGHAWVQVGDWILDPTVEQFRDDELWLVGNVTFSWESVYDVRRGRTAYGCTTASQLRAHG
jgi:hypothetical protein